MAEPLTGRERKMLRHMSDMLDTAEVTIEICLSANTVKTNLGSIYRGRLADSPYRAIRRARQVELIGPG